MGISEYIKISINSCFSYINRYRYSLCFDNTEGIEFLSSLLVHTCNKDSQFCEYFIFCQIESNFIFLIIFFKQVLSGVLLFLNKKYGLRTSGLIFLFWMFFVLFNIPRVRTEYRANNFRSDHKISDSWAQYQFVSFMISFAMFCALWLLNCWADREPLESKYPKSEVRIFLITKEIRFYF